MLSKPLCEGLIDRQNALPHIIHEQDNILTKTVCDDRSRYVIRLIGKLKCMQICWIIQHTLAYARIPFLLAHFSSVSDRVF